MLIALLLGCPAEWLRVPLPQGGVDALSMEDVQRDVWSLTQLDDRRPGQPDHVQGVEITEQRLIQMHLLPGFGDKSYRAKAGEGLMLCGSRGGRSQRAVVVVALDAGQGASSAASVASVVSLAKTWDTPEPPAHTLVFCVVPGSDLSPYLARPAVPLDDTELLLAIGPLTQAPLVEHVSDGHVTLGVAQIPDPDPMEALDLEGILDHTRAIRARLDAALDG